MKYNLAIEADHKAASIYFAQLIATNAMVEVKKLSPRRTLNQNAYLHLIIGAFGVATGYTIAEAKTIFKREVNPDMFVYMKNGSKFLRSSADLSVDEMSKSIDRFRTYAGEHGIELPLATDTAQLMRIENEIERNIYL